MSTVEEILQAASSLSEKERFQIVERLLALPESGADDDELQAEWLAVAQQTAAELDSGKQRRYTWDEVQQEAERRANERKAN